MIEKYYYCKGVLEVFRIIFILNNVVLLFKNIYSILELGFYFFIKFKFNFECYNIEKYRKF